MKKPVLVFSSIAVVAAAALGGTLYYQQNNVEPAAVESQVLPPEKKPEVAQTSKMPVEAVAPVVVPPAKVVFPTFDTVRVEASGDAIIAGHAEPGANVAVKWNGNVVGTATSGADGSFVLVPGKPLDKGTGALTLEVSKNGAVMQSEGSVIVALKDNAPALVAKVDPVAPTQVIQNGSDVAALKDVQLTAIDYDTKGNIVFSGKATPRSVVRFYVDNSSVGEGVADTTGNWSFAGTAAVAPGTHTLRADAVDAAGKVLSRIELPFLREDTATVAAAQVATAEPAGKTVIVEKNVAAEPVVVATQKVTPEPEVAAAPPAAVVVEEGPKRLVIQPGNSLWKLSREVYGKGRMYTVIYKANRDQLKNPHKIFPGQILTAPKQN